MIDRSTFYLRGDGTAMTSQERLALLLDIGGLDRTAAAEIARVSPATIEAYRKPSSVRPVPDRILIALELFVFDRLKKIARAAGYTLRKAA